jgi:hypothetical protein
MTNVYTSALWAFPQMTDVCQMLPSWRLSVDCGAVAGYTGMMVVVVVVVMIMIMTNPFHVTDVLTVGRSGAAG